MQTTIVIFIVAAAAIYVGRIFYRGFKQKDGCSCGCTCCSISDSCDEPEAGHTPDLTGNQSDR